jgi:hypothetical protein
MISDDAARLGTIANSRTAVSALASADEHIKDAIAALLSAQNAVNGDADVAAMLVGGSDGEALKGQGNDVGRELGTGLTSLQQFDPASVLGQVEAFYTAMGDTARKHGG